MNTLQQIKNLAINNINGDKESLILALNKIIALVDDVSTISSIYNKCQNRYLGQDTELPIEPIDNVSNPITADRLYNIKLLHNVLYECVNNNSISAIKLLRTYIGCGLQQAREFVEIGSSHCFSIDFNDISTLPQEWLDFIETGRI